MDRHWMEKWRTNARTGKLYRKRDGLPADGWTHAAEIEAAEKGVTRSQLLSGGSRQTVPLSELYPADVTMPESWRKDFGRGPAVGTATRKIEVGKPLTGADVVDLHPEERRSSGSPGRGASAMMVIGWAFFAAAFIVLTAPNVLAIGAVGVLMFLAGVAFSGYCLED